MWCVLSLFVSRAVHFECAPAMHVVVLRAEDDLAAAATAAAAVRRLLQIRIVFGDGRRILWRCVHVVRIGWRVVGGVRRDAQPIRDQSDALFGAFVDRRQNVLGRVAGQRVGALVGGGIVGFLRLLLVNHLCRRLDDLHAVGAHAEAADGQIELRLAEQRWLQVDAAAHTVIGRYQTVEAGTHLRQFGENAEARWRRVRPFNHLVV